MDVNTLVIGAGQAGLATSYWLTEAGVEHLVVDGRDRPGGSWPDHWDGFHLVAPNFSVRLPGRYYTGPDPDGFMHRDEIARHIADYATDIRAPVRRNTQVLRLTAIGDTFLAHTRDVDIKARNVVLATGPYQRPWHPEHDLADHIHQLHSASYRSPGQLPEGGVLVVGTGQSGTQIAEELHRAGREVHVAVSTCPAAPRRYRGRDTFWWLLQIHLHGADVGVPFPTVAELPSPAAPAEKPDNRSHDPQASLSRSPRCFPLANRRWFVEPGPRADHIRIISIAGATLVVNHPDVQPTSLPQDIRQPEVSRKEKHMNLYAIVRRNIATPDDVEAVAARSAAELDKRADRVRRIRSYVIAEPDGTTRHHLPLRGHQPRCDPRARRGCGPTSRRGGEGDRHRRGAPRPAPHRLARRSFGRPRIQMVDDLRDNTSSSA